MLVDPARGAPCVSGPGVAEPSAGSQMSCCLRMAVFLDNFPLYPLPPVSLASAPKLLLADHPIVPTANTHANARNVLRIPHIFLSFSLEPPLRLASPLAAS